MLPRCVLVERATEYRELLARHGTREQARFFLAQRGLQITDVETAHLHYEEIRAGVLHAIPRDWRMATVQRSELDRFLFGDDDIIVVLGQDGLVANLAKYLAGQPVIGLNPDPQRVAGVLVAHHPQATADLLADTTRAALASNAERWSAPHSTTDKSSSRSTRSSSATKATNQPATDSTSPTPANTSPPPE